MREASARVKRFVSALSPRTVLLVAFGCFLLYGFPGYMSSDSVLQLTEASTGKFTDGNPPLMAAEWFVLDRLISGPLLMLCLQGSLLLGGLYVLMRRALAPKPAAWVASGIFIFPPVMIVMAVIWKDAQMAAYLVAGTAALLQPRLRSRLLGIVLLVAACSVRHNAVAAALPLIAILFEWKPGLRWTKRVAIVAVVAVIVGAAGFGITRVLASKHVKLTPAFNDIVGVIAYTDTRTDEDLHHVLRGIPLAIDRYLQPHAQILVAQHHGWLVMVGPEPFFRSPGNDADWDAVNRAWKELVLGDPLAYLAFHTDQFKRLLQFPDDDLPGAIWDRFTESDDQTNWIGHDASKSWVQDRIGAALFWLMENTPLFRPYVYALLGLLTLVFNRRALPFALIFSGMLYELSFFPVGAEPEYRYSHWMIVSIVLAAVSVAIQRLQRTR